MFTIISIMFVGIGIGYVLRNLQFLQKIEKSTSLTIFLLLFVLGISIGSNSLIINNLGRFDHTIGNVSLLLFGRRRFHSRELFFA